MLKGYHVENFPATAGEALLMLRHSLWNRETRDVLLTDAAWALPGPLTFETVHRIHNSAVHTDGSSDDFRKAARRLCDAADFRELCRIFGERFSAATAFDIRYELSFSPEARDGQGRTGNKLAYMRVEITCRKAYGEDVTSFFELLRYRDGDNYELYWDNMPDVSLHFSNGRARGCNAFMRGLIVYDMQTDGVGEGAAFALLLPVICAFSRIAASQFDYIIPFGDRVGESGQALEGRSIWASPDGRVMHSLAGEAYRAWEEHYGGWISPEDAALARGVLLASPGETLVVSGETPRGGLSEFLAMQERVYKKAITD
ncbi:MAG: hypothetical protein Q4A32_06260 [Lachnospiraceae bacterium]|nr:hypothetical protein [Lachnospiraceae bacterium]